MVRSFSLACIFIVFLSFYLPFSFARDNITTTLKDFISDGETLTSAGEIFQFGFFTCGNRSNGLRRYVGIWYCKDPKTIVWVANRDTPLNNPNGFFGIAEYGNLVLFDEHKKSVWGTSLQGSGPFKGMVKLLDSGNLVLIKEDEESRSLRVIWESFQNPADTFLPGMKMDENLALVSWKDQENPAQGEYKFQLEKKEHQFVIKKVGSNYHWKSGVGGKFLLDDTDPKVSSLLYNINKSDIDPGTLIWNNTTTISSDQSDSNSRLVMNYDGKVEYFTRPEESAQWNLTWSEPKDSCNEFRACGDYASCSSSKNRLKCECLYGFEPKLPHKWESGNFSEGCLRTTPLCGSNGEKVSNFLPQKVIKVGKPDWNSEVDNETECKNKCLKDCKCQAYSCTLLRERGRSKNTTCWIWLDDLNNIQWEEIQSDDIPLNDTDGEPIIHLRVEQNKIAESNQAKKEGDDYGKNKLFNRWTMIIAVIVVASVTALAFTAVYIYTRKVKVKKQEERGSNLPLSFYDGQRHVKELIDSGQISRRSRNCY